MSLGRNIVVCSDGTGNTLEIKVSNVVRLVERLRVDDPARQVVIYDQGLGTLETTAAIREVSVGAGLRVLDAPGGPLGSVEKALGQLFGYGLKENVRQLYRAISDQYEPGASLFLFGFSRGAFTVRALAGLLFRCHLAPPDALDFDDRFDESWELFKPMERDEAAIRKMRESNQQVAVHFLGVWDTVKSYGGIKPVILPHLRHNPIVSNVRHALSLDERRAWFQHTTWGRLDMDVDKAMTRLNPADRDLILDQDVCEVWFTGAHSDVGGGDETNPASGFALRWMLGEALSVDPPLLLKEGLDPTHLAEQEGDPQIHDLRDRKWAMVERIPHWEIDNSGVLPRRVFRLRGHGERHPGETLRDGRVYVHTSVKETKSIPSSVRITRVTSKGIT